MSGLRLKSGARPNDEKVEMRPPVGLGALTISVLQVSVTGPTASRAAINSPSVPVTATTGIVIAVGPATVGFSGAATLLYSTTADAPAPWALVAFS